MAGQGMERRTVFRYLGLASVAATFPGFRQWAFACAHDAHTALASTSQYQPLFFSPKQFQLVDHLAEMIIPADETPGAHEAGVAEFIDFMVANRAPVNGSDDMADNLRIGTAVQEHFLSGLGWLDAHSKATYRHDFLECSTQQQDDLLQELAYKAKYKTTTEVGRAFFQLMRDYTVVGFYTTKIGLESLGYAGLKTFWKEAPGCTHLDDPEHLHLPQPDSVSPTALNIVK